MKEHTDTTISHIGKQNVWRDTAHHHGLQFDLNRGSPIAWAKIRHRQTRNQPCHSQNEIQQQNWKEERRWKKPKIPKKN